jgi:predicted dehydrogenase
MTLRVAVSGSGHRSRSVWQRHLRELDGFELVGVQDIAAESLAQADVDEGMRFRDLGQLLDRTRPDALIVCPIHSAHAAAVEAGLAAGCHVLVEKPFTTELADAVRLTEAAEAAGLTLAVVQNWRTRSVGEAMRRAIAAGDVGDVSHVFFRYLRDRELPHLPDYLFDEPNPLLYAMTIHHLDLFRYVLGQEIVSVEGHASRPRWSRYTHPSIVQLWLETDGGVVISYAATFSSRSAHLPLESVQVEGELGTLSNESAYSEPPLLLLRRGEEPVDLTADVAARSQEEQYVIADTAILQNFSAAVTDGARLIASARDNLGTLAAIDAARLALERSGPVRVADLMAPVR